MNTFTAFYNKNMFSMVMDFANGFVPLMTIKAKNLEEAFWKMQGENISPNGELRDTIKSLGLKHTSMSVGDVLYWHEKDAHYRVEIVGFKQVPLT